MLNLNQETPYDTLPIDDFKNTVLSCQKCELCHTRTNVVFGSGPIPCNLMIIGEGLVNKKTFKAFRSLDALANY